MEIITFCISFTISCAHSYFFFSKYYKNFVSMDIKRREIKSSNYSDKYRNVYTIYAILCII